ncbi:MAG: NYN domain-containing protein [Anaerolineae bacterium]|nr:NYN domain-containing protein [Anaerolineae bacterium]
MYLVDGHNLIGQLQDLSLDDPQDEAKLTVAIRRFCMRHRVKTTVIFDNGVIGGTSRELSNSDVTVIFASPGQQADTLLMRRAREHGTIKGKYDDMVLVTSDRRILRLAFAYGIDTMASEEFALMIGFRPVEREVEDPDKANGKTEKRIAFVYEKDPNPVISTQEIAYWLTVFKRRQWEVRAARMAQQDAAAKNLKSTEDTGKPKSKSKPESDG